MILGGPGYLDGKFGMIMGKCREDAKRIIQIDSPGTELVHVP